MPTEDELRELFRAEPPPGTIDVDAVVRRARARRVPRVLGVGVAAVLALGAIAVPVTIASVSARSASSMSAADAPAADSSAGSASQPGPEVAGGATIDRAPAEKLNLCTGTLADVAPASNGLVLTLQPTTAVAGSDHVDVTVTLTNTGSTEVTGYTGGSPALTLSKDGVVLWHSNGPSIAIAALVDLKPGESRSYPARFVPVACGVDDELASTFRAGLPALPPGAYQLSAAIDLRSDRGDASVLVTGPTAPLTLTN